MQIGVISMQYYCCIHEQVATGVVQVKATKCVQYNDRQATEIVVYLYIYIISSIYILYSTKY